MHADQRSAGHQTISLIVLQKILVKENYEHFFFFFFNSHTNASTNKTGWSKKPNLTPHTYKSLFDKTLNSMNLRIFSSLHYNVKKH